MILDVGPPKFASACQRIGDEVIRQALLAVIADLLFTTCLCHLLVPIAALPPTFLIADAFKAFEERFYALARLLDIQLATAMPYMFARRRDPALLTTTNLRIRDKTGSIQFPTSENKLSFGMVCLLRTRPATFAHGRVPASRIILWFNLEKHMHQQPDDQFK